MNPTPTALTSIDHAPPGQRLVDSCRRARRLAIIFCLAAAALAASSTTARANTFTVNTVLDEPADPPDGDCGSTVPVVSPCSLREAIREANANGAVADLIKFSIPGCGTWCTLVLTLPLDPLLADNTTIDGFDGLSSWGNVGSNIKPGVLDWYNPCQNLSFRKPRIAINGPDAGGIPSADQFPFFTLANGLTIGPDASNILIKGLSIYGTADNAIEAMGFGLGTNRTVDSMFIGVLPTGADPGVPNRNQAMGVRQLDGGILNVKSSFVGYNGQVGVDGQASTSVIHVSQNEVFKNGWNTDAHDGIDINGINGSARCNLSRDNTNNTGTPDTREARGDSGSGLEIGSKEAVTTVVLDNNIAEYNTLYRNLSSGVSVRKGVRGNFIRKNVIWENQVGISVNTEGRFPTNRNLLSTNSTFRNHGLGIDLQKYVTPDAPWMGNPDGKTPNDECDIDGSPVLLPEDGSLLNEASNDLQNFPVLTSSKRRKNKTFISGTFNSNPNRWYDIEFFSTPAPDLSPVSGPAADREGKFFLGHTMVHTDGTCNASFIDFPLMSGVPDNHRIFATARLFEDDPLTAGDATTEPWSTSEFSASIKPMQEDNDDFDSDRKRDDVDSDDDNDGKKDDVDSDDDNDGKKDDVDSDDDDDGIKDRDDSRGHKERKDSETDRLPHGQSHSYQMSADSSSLLLVAVAEEALQDAPIPDPDNPLDPPLPPLDQPLVVDIFDPIGNLVATSLPTPGAAVATTVPLAQGLYTVRIRNQSARDVTYDSSFVTREVWPLP